MSAQYTGLIAELSANATIPGKQLEAIMTAYPTCWGYAAPVTDAKTGVKKMLMAATKLPEGWSAKDLQDMKAEIRGTPEMMEYFGKMPDNTEDVCMQPFPLLENDGGGVTLCLFMEGDFEHWAKEDEPNHSPEYICYRDKITPLVNKLNNLVGGNITKLVKELGSSEFQDILEGTFNERGVIYFLADNGASQLIEGGNDKRKDEDWGSTSNEVPEVEAPVVEAPVEEPAKELTLAEKRKLRQQGSSAVKPNPPGVHTVPTKPAIQQKDTSLSEQRIKESLNSSTTASASKGPFLFTLPQTIKTEDEAKNYWRTNFGTCPDNWKHKDANSKWVPSYTAGFPYEKSAKGSVIRDKYNADGSLKSGSKGFAALDDIANGKTATTPTTSAGDGDTRPASAPAKLPIMPVAVRDKVIAEITKLDLKSRKIMSNDEIKETEKKHSTLFAQLNNTPPEDLWRLSYAEIDRLNRTYPDFGSVWLFSLRNFQIQNWKILGDTTKKEEPEATGPEPELTLAQKRAARKAAAA
jgi:hypothetical protein